MLILTLLVLMQVSSDVVPSWIQNISDVGLVVFLIIVMYGGIKDKPWWVTGREYRAALRREEVYREMVFRSLNASEEAAKTLSKAVRIDDE